MQNRPNASTSCQFFKAPRLYAEPNISIGQALLMLINHYQKQNKKNTCAEVKTLYMRGAISAEVSARIKKFMRHPLLKSYHPTSNAYITDADPARRYFETHLAFHTLKQQLTKIDLSDLKLHFDCIFNLLSAENKEDVAYVFDRPFAELMFEALIKKEYNDAIQKLSSSDHFKQFSAEEKEKLCWMMKISYVSIYLATIYNETLPINIYGTGLFEDAARGRVAKNPIAQASVKSLHLGLMKSYMPVPLNDIATSDEFAPYLRPVDEYSFDPKSKWAKINFRTQVHPFASSISGTLLGQLRIMKYLHQNQCFAFQHGDKLKDYLRCYIAFLLYNSGGHSLHEFTYLFQDPDVQKAFAFIPEFKSFNEDTLFHIGNETAFDQALQETIAYNKVLLAKTNTHWLLQKTQPRIEPIESEEKEKSKPKATLLGVNRYIRRR